MASAASGGGTGSDCDGEEQEDPSSSNEVLQINNAIEHLDLQDEPKDEGDDELSVFRMQWQRELDGTTSPQGEPTPKEPLPEPLTDEEKAKQLFLRGVELERGGELYEAVRQYRRALQILPDVESRLYQGCERAPDSPDEESETEEVRGGEPGAASDEEDEVEGEELLARLQRLLARRGRLCEPACPTKGAHISCLPYEVVLEVLRWVVGAELDAGSLERAAAACRGLYVAAREPDLWRSLCVRTWGIECGTPRALGFPSWRDMFVARPRLQLHGCYISKTTYLRHGEPAFQDRSYRPWYLVEYYRYLRFFADGAVLMWTTPEPPAACVAQLRRAHKPGLGILGGHYRLSGDQVTVVVRAGGAGRARSRRRGSHEQHDQTFHLELQLCGSRSRRNSRLAWRGYAARARGQRSQFELSPSRFPPFSFSRVRQYTAEAHAPLPATHAYT